MKKPKAQRQLAKCHMHSRRAESELSRHLPRGPIEQSGSESEKPLPRGGCPRTLLIVPTSHSSSSPVEPPNLREGSPSQELPDHMLSWVLSCQHFCLLCWQYVEQHEGVPGTKQLLEKESLTAPRQPPALFLFPGGPMATARNTSLYQAAGSCVLWFLC